MGLSVCAFFPITFFSYELEPNVRRDSRVSGAFYY